MTNFKSVHQHGVATFWVGDMKRDLTMDFIDYNAVCQLVNEAYKAGRKDAAAHIADRISDWAGKE